MTVVQNYTCVTPQQQTELKEKYHLTFQSDEPKHPIQEASSTFDIQMEAFRQLLDEERQEHHQTQDKFQQQVIEEQRKMPASNIRREQEEIQLKLEQEQHMREQERKSYEHRIDSLIQLLTQRNSKD